MTQGFYGILCMSSSSQVCEEMGKRKHSSQEQGQKHLVPVDGVPESTCQMTIVFIK